ncbi:sugar ABC transporter substrate-binding protein [[Mycobacterium] burgundiense]|uniref:Substrate-binding domain-containing protein n=1 Tax=[Mycobacterium] burgundiense TaxID=3064286 RepID=A0ABM9LC97_9MYCO|nr:substrate-binding domain-containing protein [Mycolicibacterium sp. MU0053]CAJ1496541.1 substrate-binding domain-containing protein [Mycolicibacterium sp. MU0053]
MDGVDTAITDISTYEQAAKAAMQPIVEWPGPADGPPAQSGVKVMWIACGFAAEGCKAPAQAAEAAADALGWELRVVDGQLDPRIYNRAVSEAIDQGYDAVILNALSVDAVAGAVQRARAAGIVVGSWDGGNEPSPHGVTFEVDQPIAQQGANMASYMIWKSGGNTNAYLTEAPEFNVVRGWIQGARETLETCRTCDIVREDKFTAAEASTRVPTLMVSALRENPRINTVIGAYDASMLSALPSIRGAKFQNVRVGAFNGIAPWLQLIRDGQANATSAVPIKWGAWAAFDNVNRLMAGQDVVAQNVPTRLITSENIDEISGQGQWEGDIDYMAEYRRIWTAS